MSSSLAPGETQVGLIIRERDPVNLEYPFDQPASTAHVFLFVPSRLHAPFSSPRRGSMRF